MSPSLFASVDRTIDSLPTLRTFVPLQDEEEAFEDVLMKRKGSR